MARRLSRPDGDGPALATRAWWSVAAVATSFGLGVGLLALPPLDLLLAALLGCLAGAVVQVGRCPEFSLTRLVVGAGWGGVAGAGLAGVGVVSGWLALSTLLVLTATHPGFVHWVRAEISGVRGDAEPVDQLPPDDVADELSRVVGEQPGRLSDRELCLAWRRSYFHLLQAGSPRARLEMAARRQAILDEFEARHPQAFQAWLESGARPAGNPQPFLTRRQDLPPAA